MKRFTYFLFVMCLTFLSSFSICFADTGPKDTLIVYVENPPQEKYYLDLLMEKDERLEAYPNIDEEDETLNQDMMNLIKNYQKDRYVPALIHGTYAPMWGELEGEKQGDKMVHKFGYFGLPEKYKIIIVTESGEVKVSDTYERKTLSSSITFDYAANEGKVPTILKSYAIQFISTCIPTILIEGILLIIFGFKLKDNYKVFLFTNIATQIFLTATLGTILIKNGTILAYIAIIPLEICILVTETIIFTRFLKGYSKIRKISYGILANILSFLLGFYFVSYQYEMLTKFL